ncbi:MAG TPA: hypothetical protein VFI02_03730 [Armatimonadota bacterium]|nr:hypothetical protein [Armatimonadota bacterium]
MSRFPGTDQLLASLALAAVYLASEKDQLGSYCWGFSNGVTETLRCLGIDQDTVHPRVLTGTEDELDRKCFAGAASLIESFESTFEKAAVLEETNPVIIEKKAEFRREAKERYNQFVKDTVLEN